jgi:hypothetical protein
LLRRATPKDGAPAKEANSNVLERGQLRMDPEQHSCTWKNEPVTLTVTEFLILQALASRPGVVKSRNALMDAAYDDKEYVDDRTIDSHIKRLRIKFRANDVEFDMVRRFTALAIVSKKYERRPRTRRRITYCLLISALFVEVTVRKRWRRYQCGKVLKPYWGFSL